VNNSKIVTIIIAFILALGTPICGALAWGWNDHNSRPHHGAATHVEVTSVEARLNSHVERIENKLDVILEHLMHHNDP